MRQLLVIAAVLLGAAPTFAFDAQVHEKCLKESDYKGCVEALSGGVRVADSEIKQLKKSSDFLNAIADIDDASLTGEYEALSILKLEQLVICWMRCKVRGHLEFTMVLTTARMDTSPIAVKFSLLA